MVRLTSKRGGRYDFDEQDEFDVYEDFQVGDAAQTQSQQQQQSQETSGVRSVSGKKSVKIHEPVRVMDDPLLNDQEEQTVEVIMNPVGIYGWKKYFLYLAVLVFTCLAIVNIGLVVYVMRVMHITSSGAGAMQFRSDSVSVRGWAEMTEGLQTPLLAAYDNQGLSLQSNKDIVLRTVDETTLVSSSVTVDSGAVTYDAPTFQMSHQNTPYLSASASLIRLQANETRIESTVGVAVKGTMQTNHIRNLQASGAGLTLQSLTQHLLVQAARNVSVTSSNGDLSVEGLLGITLTTPGTIALSAQQVTMASLPTAAAAAAAAALAFARAPSFRRGLFPPRAVGLRTRSVVLALLSLSSAGWISGARLGRPLDHSDEKAAAVAEVGVVVA
eukprot:m.123272 g.123272  ORF g.123272 m.123272 type:complete len:385 (+) comp16244_c2_seq16:97-1251(+)